MSKSLAIAEAKAKLAKFEQDQKVIGGFKAEAAQEAKGVMAARHETELLKPVYE